MNQCASPGTDPRGWSPTPLTRLRAGRGRAQRPHAGVRTVTRQAGVRTGTPGWVRTRSWLLCQAGDSPPGPPVADRSDVDPGGVQLGRAGHDEVAARG